MIRHSSTTSHTSQENRLARQQEFEYIVLPETDYAQEKNLQTYIRLLRRRKWLVIAPLLLFLPLALLHISTQKASYQATATVLIERVNPHVISIEEVVSTERTTSSPDFYRTQYEIIKSPLIIAQVVDALRLYEEKVPQEESSFIRTVNEIKSFPGRMIGNTINAMIAFFSDITDTKQPIDALEAVPAFEGMITAHRSTNPIEKYRESLIAQLQSSLVVEPRKGTQLVDITLTGRSGEKIAQQVNKVAEVYVKQNLEYKLDASKKAIEWLKKEAKDLRSKIDSAELALREFKERKKFIPPNEINELRDPLFNDINVLQSSHAQASSARINLRNQIEEVKKSLNKDLEVITSAIPILENNISIKPLIDRYVELKTQYHSASEKVKENHPLLLQITSETSKIKDAIRAEMANLIQGMQEEYRMLLEREKLLEKAIQEQRRLSVDFSNNVMEYNRLIQELEVDKNLYLAVSKRLAETTLTEALETNNIKVLQLAPVPKNPLPSGVQKKLLFSVVVSLAFGAGLALFIESLDNRFKSVEEAERYLGIPFLGIVPSHKARRNKPVTLYNPGTSASEAYRTLRTWIRLSSPTPIKTLLITSANLGEGKSHTAANLAISFAQLGQMVLLVDADLRRPTLHRTFNVANRSGLIEILERGAEWKSVLQDTTMENLKILPAGGRPPNPAELLSTQRMQSLLGSLKDNFDIIIVDAPITLAIPDVVILVSAMDAVLLVHYPLKGDRETVLDAKKTLDRAGANLLGMIFNNIKSKMQAYYGRPQSYHRYSDSPVMLRRQRQIDVTFVDMRPTENKEKWIAASPPANNPSNHDS
jgi:capsular exopolysaccharide synthesis family protein